MTTLHEWVDYRVHIWALPLSAVIIVGVTILFAVFPLLIYFGGEGVGASEERKAGVTAVSVVAFIGGLYACIGLYQIFFHEVLRLFIVRKAVRYGDKLELSGYYFKKDVFDLLLVKSVKSFSVQKWKRFKVPWKNMMTLFNYEKPESNYKILLKDGRTYYLPGDMNNVEDLRLLLESFAQVDG